MRITEASTFTLDFGTRHRVWELLGNQIAHIPAEATTNLIMLVTDFTM